MIDTVIFKAKVSGVSWEETEPIGFMRWNDEKTTELCGFAYNLSRVLGREVRWNWQNSPQGHYFFGDPLNYIG